MIRCVSYNNSIFGSRMKIMNLIREDKGQTISTVINAK